MSGDPESGIAVVGAGPAGLMAAIAVTSLSRSGVIVLEKGPVAGRKLLASGSGQCNVTHAGAVDDFVSRYGANGKFLKPSLQAFPPQALCAFLAAHGVKTVEEDSGKVFPESRRARDILDVLLRECGRAGVEIKSNAGVGRVTLVDGLFVLSLAEGEVRARKLIIATGGASYPGLGSEGDGYAMAESLGHSIVTPGPALAPVKVTDYLFADCAGIALRHAAISIWRDGRKAGASRGDVLFTHEGLSGPGILDASRGMRGGDELRVALGPYGDPAEADAAFRSILEANTKRTVLSCLKEMGLPERLASLLLKLSGMDLGIKASVLPKTARLSLSSSLAGHAFRVKSLGGWDVAMATRGGVSLDEVSPKTLASKLVPGLYFAGEVLDIDGDTGGFNLQAAFSTGWLAGRNAAG